MKFFLRSVFAVLGGVLVFLLLSQAMLWEKLEELAASFQNSAMVQADPGWVMILNGIRFSTWWGVNDPLPLTIRIMIPLLVILFAFVLTEDSKPRRAI